MNPEGDSGAPERGGSSAVAVAEIILCLLPTSAAWMFGVAASLWMAAHGAALFAVFISSGLCCAAFGIAALWSRVLPQALGRRPARPLREWQMAGLAVGFLAGAIGVVLSLAGLFGAGPRRLLWLYLFAGPILVALHVACQAARGAEADSDPS